MLHFCTVPMDDGMETINLTWQPIMIIRYLHRAWQSKTNHTMYGTISIYTCCFLKTKEWSLCSRLHTSAWSLGGCRFGWWLESSQSQWCRQCLSCTGFGIFCTCCPDYWQSKLQTEIALLTADAEYIAMALALRETIPLATLMRWMNAIFPLYLPSPKLIIKVCEDNQSCIAMAENPKFTPRTKRIAIKNHHFWKVHFTWVMLHTWSGCRHLD